MIKITLKTLARAIDSGSMDRFSDDLFWAAYVRHRIKRIRKQMREAYEVYKDDQTDLCKRYGQLVDRDDGAVIYKFPDPDQKTEFDKESKKLNEEILTIEGEPFYEDTDLIRKVSDPKILSGADLDNLDWLILEGKKPDPEPEPEREADPEIEE